MNITIIGTGNVGSTLADSFKKAGHNIIFGVRDEKEPFKGKDFATAHSIPWKNIREAVEQSEVIVLCAPGYLAHEVAGSLGDVSQKVIIDTMNAVFKKPGSWSNTSIAILDNCNCIDVVKCFNSTGYENMGNPVYNGIALDMFVAGNSQKGKDIATTLAKDIGFGKTWDFGGNDNFDLLEQLAMCWINLAILQKHGRNIGMKILQRND